MDRPVQSVPGCTHQPCSRDGAYGCHSLMSRAERDVLAGQAALACTSGTLGVTVDMSDVYCLRVLEELRGLDRRWAHAGPPGMKGIRAEDALVGVATASQISSLCAGFLIPVLVAISCM